MRSYLSSLFSKSFLIDDLFIFLKKVIIFYNM